MAARIGRKVVMTWNGAPVGGVREKSMTFNSEAIDITDENSNGMRELMDEGGENSIDLTISGITKDQILKKAYFDRLVTPAAATKTVTLTYPDGGVISCSMRLGNYTEGDPYKEGATFEAQLQSTGAITFTPGS